MVLAVWFCRTESYTAFWLLTLLAFAIGVLIIIPIGGADMPVVGLHAQLLLGDGRRRGSGSPWRTPP